MLKIQKLPIVLFAFFIISLPFAIHTVPAIGNYTNVMVFSGIYCIITIGLSLFIGYTGQISLGHAAFFGIGAYTTAILTTRYAFPTFVAFGASAVSAAAIAYLI